MRPRSRTGSRLQPSHDGLLAESEHQPEARLVLAIFLQAIHDARYGDHDAWAFLTSDSGPWARSRRDLAWSVGVDPDNLRRWVLETIKPPAADQPSKARVSTLAPKKYPPMRAAILEALVTTGPIHPRDLGPIIGRDEDSTRSMCWNLAKEGLVEKVAPAIFQLKTSTSMAA